jgi:hypothetical protein
MSFAGWLSPSAERTIVSRGKRSWAGLALPKCSSTPEIIRIVARACALAPAEALGGVCGAAETSAAATKKNMMAAR